VVFEDQIGPAMTNRREELVSVRWLHEYAARGRRQRATICFSLKRLPFIVRSSPGDGLYLILAEFF
jgi:hypothetical protein